MVWLPLVIKWKYSTTSIIGSSRDQEFTKLLQPIIEVRIVEVLLQQFSKRSITGLATYFLEFRTQILRRLLKQGEHLAKLSYFHLVSEGVLSPIWRKRKKWNHTWNVRFM